MFVFRLVSPSTTPICHSVALSYRPLRLLLLRTLRSPSLVLWSPPSHRALEGQLRQSHQI